MYIKNIPLETHLPCQAADEREEALQDEADVDVGRLHEEGVELEEVRGRLTGAHRLRQELRQRPAEKRETYAQRT